MKAPHHGSSVDAAFFCPNTEVVTLEYRFYLILIPPVEAEERYYRQLAAQAAESVLL